MALEVKFSLARNAVRNTFLGLQKPIARAATAAMDATVPQVKQGGRSVIRAAGFSGRFANSWRVTRYPKKGDSLDPAIWAYSSIARVENGKRVEYAGVFEKGAKITGSPLLWLPLPTAPKIGRRKMTASLYIKTIGPLHRINRPGKAPLLAGYVRGTSKGRLTVGKLKSGERRRKAKGGKGLVSVPLFVGIAAVKIRKRFDFSGMWRKAMVTLSSEYARNLKGD